VDSWLELPELVLITTRPFDLEEVLTLGRFHEGFTSFPIINPGRLFFIVLKRLNAGKKFRKAI
jgi:hypothetical protein